MQAAKSVTDGYHRNLSTALADMYQTHAGSFLAGIIYRLCGNNLDLITLMHAQQEWTASRPADNTLLQSMMRFCESRTVAELPALMNQVNVISILGEADYTNFRPAHEFPLFGEVHAAVNTIKASSSTWMLMVMHGWHVTAVLLHCTRKWHKLAISSFCPYGTAFNPGLGPKSSLTCETCFVRQDDALLSLELAERSLPEAIMAAMEERITSDAAIAGLQECLLLDGSLRLRYAKVYAYSMYVQHIRTAHMYSTSECTHGLSNLASCL